tara:strand:+ start:392 stop:2083 length:1692 start_codon:yes stop_codon:yes gene_type:complete
MKKIIENIKKQLKEYDLDGYVIPKNDEYFSEYSEKDRLRLVSNFTGSAGYAVILRKKNYLFVDGRYTLQAKIESGKYFKIEAYEKLFNCKIFKNLKLGIDPKLFTKDQIKNFFSNNKIIILKKNIVDNIIKFKKKKVKPFYSLSEIIVGEGYKKRIQKIVNFLKENNLEYIFITAPENIAWILNIRGYDNPNSPIPNSNLIISKKGKKWIIANKDKLKNLIKQKKINNKEVLESEDIEKFNISQNRKNISIDSKTCSIYNEEILRKKFNVKKIEDPIYLLKSVKNKTEIKNMIKAHISDGVALTKFIYWIKKINKKKITEFDAQKKLEKFRQKNKDYLFPSFDTIAGSGKNGAIVHYRASQNNTRYINNKDIFLCDSGGQYKYGTTDVTRTICFSNQNSKIKNIFTNVLKGHIAVANVDISKKKIGKNIDIEARKFLKRENLDYKHGTGHGVGYFLNVHEGPQAISKFNDVKIKEGMIISNEPGYYLKEKFGIRIENLVYSKKINGKLVFKNLTLAPIEKDLINFTLLSNKEKNYLFKYHYEVYLKISPYLKKNEKKWLATFI